MLYLANIENPSVNMSESWNLENIVSFLSYRKAKR